MAQMVTVIFDVETDDRAEAEELVAQRLHGARLLWENDSNDIMRGTLDKINTYVVVPAAKLLDDEV